ncbi:MAG: hypothetical protein PHY14_02255 [Candidatus Gracilibacteria bacterium]|nr:hypothetical protein [Candidatus Gracilibacteria bacterium]
MNVGNQVKIAGVQALIATNVTKRNSKQLLSRIQVEVELLRHGLRLEKGLARIQVSQAIQLLEGKVKEIVEKQ